MIKFLRKQEKGNKNKISAITVIKENRQTAISLISKRRIRRLPAFNIERRIQYERTSLSHYFEGVNGLIRGKTAYRA